MLAGEFIAIGPHGFIFTKPQWLERFHSGILRYDDYAIAEISVRVFGDVAIVTSLDRIRGRNRERAVNGMFRTSQMWTRQMRGWRLTSLQLSPVSQRDQQIERAMTG